MIRQFEIFIDTRIIISYKIRHIHEYLPVRRAPCIRFGIFIVELEKDIEKNPDLETSQLNVIAAAVTGFGIEI
jgi:hypothetical protein